MIRPVRFESNPHTAKSNRFQGRSNRDAAGQQQAALAEFDRLAAELRSAGIDVIVVNDTPEPHTPDSVFPNNWLSMHADGRAVLYPMEAPNRRTERREDILSALVDEHGFRISELVDLTTHEERNEFLEGTGSLVLDRCNRIAYACFSSRTHPDALAEFAIRLDYEIVAFDAVDRSGDPIYHTNVMMNVGEQLAVICDASIADDAQRQAVIQRLEETGHKVLKLSFDQLDAFAGNMLELRNSAGERVVAMSKSAYDSLNADQLTALKENGHLVFSAIDDIEASAGGSVRCMLAEVHLPRQDSRD